MKTIDNKLDEHRRKAYLQVLGVDLWLQADTSTDDVKVSSQPSEQGVESEVVVNIATQSKQPSKQTSSVIDAPTLEVSALQAMDLSGLSAFVSTCTQCDLHKTRTQTVFGVGHPKADWLIIGEAPGADEDRQGEPFVGRAGQLLTQMLRAIGLAREEVFIANILKCRPPNNRDPRMEEVLACNAYLNRQIELLEPKIILALGRIAAQSLLNSTTPIGKMRGKLYQFGEKHIPVTVTYHPAYLLRSPKEKRKVWEDLKFARQQVMSQALSNT